MLDADMFAQANSSVRDGERIMPTQENPGEDRARTWGQWLTHALHERDMTPAEFRKTLVALAGGSFSFSSGTISSWRSGDKPPSEAACLYIARALHEPVPEVLRAGGYEEIAAVLEAEPPSNDPRLTRIRGADLSPAQASALEEFYRERIADLDDLLDARIARIMGNAEQVSPEPQDGDADVS
jgi:transcriptional regulator with XRE-family HTH domain